MLNHRKHSSILLHSFASQDIEISNCMVFISIQVSVKAGINYQKKLSGNRRSTKLSFHTTTKLRFSGSDTRFKLLFNCSFFRRCFSLIRVGVYVQLLQFNMSIMMYNKLQINKHLNLDDTVDSLDTCKLPLEFSALVDSLVD